MILIELRINGRVLYMPYLSHGRLIGEREFFFPSVHTDRSVFVFHSQLSMFRFLSEFDNNQTVDGHGKIDVDQVQEWLTSGVSREPIADDVAGLYGVMIFISSDLGDPLVPDDFEACAQLTRACVATTVYQVLGGKANDAELKENLERAYTQPTVSEIMRGDKIRKEVSELLPRFLTMLEVRD